MATAVLPERLSIRFIRQCDLPQVYGIEAATFPFPWEDMDFVRCLHQRNCHGMVAERGGVVVGYMIYELHKERLHLLNIAVHAACQRQGVGTSLIRELHSKLAPQRRRIVMLECRETNLDAHLFFKAMGFRAIAILEDFYDERPDEAAYLFRLDCGGFAPC